MVVPKPNRRIFAKTRTYNAALGKWSTWKNHYTPTNKPNTRSSRTKAPPSPWVFEFPRRGVIRVWPDAIDPVDRDSVNRELLDNSHKIFRQYRIQGGNEPRVHGLLHEKATHDDFETSEQPGYKYGNITMKAKPLGMLEHVQALSEQMKVLSGIEDYWTVGVNVISYRDGNDSMGWHGDNDQGETHILTAVTDSPRQPRCVQFQAKSRYILIKVNDEVVGERKLPDGDKEVQVQIFMQAGDVYDMDGELQKHYVHGVPKDKEQTGDCEDRRIAIVFRCGTEKFFKKDSGKEVTDLSPRDCEVVYKFGSAIEGLQEGGIYARTQLRDMRAHQPPQAGVSGNQKVGCDSIVVSGAREDGQGEDNFVTLMYAATTKQGAKAILKNMEVGQPLRVFRSSDESTGAFRAITNQNKTKMYRYDGLYKAVKVEFDKRDGEGKLSKTVEEFPDGVSEPVPGRLYKFHLERIDQGEGDSANHFGSKRFIDFCVEEGTMMDPGPSFQHTIFPPKVTSSFMGLDLNSIIPVGEKRKRASMKYYSPIH